MRRLAALAVGLALATPAFAQRPPPGGLAPRALPSAPSPSPAPPEAGTPPSSPLPSERVLPLSLAREAAAAAVAACAEAGYRVSAAVTDRAGQVRALLRADGAGPHTVDSSARKAYTAASLKAPTSRYARISARPEAAALRDVDRLLLLGGGLPIEVGDDVVGAIGVGGAPGDDKDEACAQAGRDAIKDRLR